MRPMPVRKVPGMMAMFCFLSLAARAGWSQPACPLSEGSIDVLKSHKLYLYFPTSADATYPDYGFGVSPAQPFNVADLDSTIGTTNALKNRIHDVVVDDYCEFNVQVIQTTQNPGTLPSPPARRATVAIGSDDPDNGWGLAQVGDTGNAINVDFARTWAGRYVACEGSNGSGCSMLGSLTGANATLDRWANAIGGTAAHEAGHLYGMFHSTDDPPSGCNGTGQPVIPGEDGFKRHLMPAGCNLDGEDRAGYRRHISDRGFGILATNVGLSIQTMHNWDLVNPNPDEARSLTMDFLSTKASVTVGWSYSGSPSPWKNPVVSGPFGTTVWQGTTYNNFRITWSTPNPAWAGVTPGLLPGGEDFHIGASFIGVDFNQPDAIIIQDITLYDAGASPLPLHPRLPMYDTGTVNAADGTFNLNFFPPASGAPMVLDSAVVYQLPRVASIESMIGRGNPLTFANERINPWSSSECERQGTRGEVRCILANLSDRPHVEVTHRVGEPGVYDCSRGIPRVTAPDSLEVPDYEGPVCAGTSRDPFPSTTVYVIATFVDREARHWDPVSEEMVTGPVTSKVFYQFAGVRDVRRITPPPSTAPPR